MQIISGKVTSESLTNLIGLGGSWFSLHLRDSVKDFVSIDSI